MYYNGFVTICKLIVVRINERNGDRVVIACVGCCITRRRKRILILLVSSIKYRLLCAVINKSGSKKVSRNYCLVDRPIVLESSIVSTLELVVITNKINGSSIRAYNDSGLVTAYFDIRRNNCVVLDG